MTYDQLQLKAPLRTCTVCQRLYYVAAREIPEPFVCALCRWPAVWETARECAR